MQITTHAAELRKINPKNIAFVPTMGALHEGHVSLIREAKKLSDHVVVSVFVNPLQFEDGKDLKTYPRTPQSDLEVAEHAGVSTLWLPETREIYPGPIEEISPGAIGAMYEGAHRTGHFSGVLTVVKRLFDLVQPHWAIFGEKDFQQLYLIRRMVRDQQLSMEIVSVPTVRENSGLAISSQFASLPEMQKALDETLAAEPAFIRDYAAIIDENDFELASIKTYARRALVAGWINGVRLIDNMPMIGDRS
jgi:pantoate--beta-alanine ligase